MILEQPEKLVEQARAARLRAYAPYSRYLVGAAVLTAAGDVFTGCNIENASYGLTICAERVAIASAIAAGQRDFVMLALVTANGGSPCGACRQVMVEFAPDMPVIIADEQGIRQTLPAHALIPGFFGPEHLTP
ncbi:MAG: cytidine deaminase [Anaerolineae bacterium]|nr:cytidine deaminase [Anaerolineae bacterium]MBK7200363.1 cytidine deaminase [Anaerolineae bacterium]MBK9091331.1 cytidine deaminase [Anaerolineae bacterium]MBK9231608.1 cytidine deaminase [Anaerolineae bacterium]